VARTQIRERFFAVAIFIFVAALLTFTLFPRPILGSGDIGLIEEFLRQHNSFFYKILYADSNAIGVANFFMLTPLPLLLQAYRAQISSWIIFAICLALTLAIEGMQWFIPGRVSDYRDVLANLVSVVIGLITLQIWHAKTDH
jgi:VanZ family protein